MRAAGRHNNWLRGSLPEEAGGDWTCWCGAGPEEIERHSTNEGVYSWVCTRCGRPWHLIEPRTIQLPSIKQRLAIYDPMIDR